MRLLPDRRHKATARLQFLDERLGNLGRRRGQDDAVEGRGLRPSAIAIAAAGPDPVMAKAIEIGACPLAERFHYLNGIDRPG